MVLRQVASTGQMVEYSTASLSKQPKSVTDTLQVKVWSPFHVYYDAAAKSVSGVNGTGPFDILPRHRNFITILNASDLVLQTREGEVKIRISGGVMHVHRNLVTVYLEA